MSDYFWIIVIVLSLALIRTVFFKCNKEYLKILARQAARWSLAAEQDKSPLVALLHANYGAAYLWAMLDIATPAEIERETGIDYATFREKIVSIQDSVTSQVSKKYPSLSEGSDTYLSKVAGKA